MGFGGLGTRSDALSLVERPVVMEMANKAFQATLHSAPERSRWMGETNEGYGNR